MSESLQDKIDYMRSRGQTRFHTCHWPGCEEQVSPARWGCNEHWSRLPHELRRKVWDAYEIGQEETMTPSPKYREVAQEVQQWIESQGG